MSCSISTGRMINWFRSIARTRGTADSVFMPKSNAKVPKHDHKLLIYSQLPWRRALREERCLPATVRGPVECLAFSRLVSARLLEDAPFAISEVKVSCIIFPVCYGNTRGFWGGRGGGGEVVEGEGVNKVGFGVTATRMSGRS